ncbi:SIS domain-containing protein [Alteromonas sediminis]|uniref:SIS domain-containing protein n=1 Tax=Alteromonas sediminis TaxID=2259342 RepID=A0A3N5YLI3_9ALTE|nr:SIS domain-containing protein [Alteromonas sediminis]RPJ66001.1 SIS domain-containing protein [Alteromonas sediminis]
MQTSIMAKEARESASVIKHQLAKNSDVCKQVAAHLRELDPAFVLMVGRGSSDHAGVFAKYLIEVEVGIPVAAAAPSVTGVYGSQLSFKNGVVIVISQSGRSPDIIRQVEMAKKGGAYCIALVNDETSPLGEIVDAVIPLSAGEEKAVAATKSYLATLSAICQLVSHWKADEALLSGLEALPAAMEEVVKRPPQLSSSSLADVRHCVVLGRGFGYAVSKEIALKLKEVLSIHAEAFSSAEFLHGPVTLVERKLNIVNVAVRDESTEQHLLQIEEVSKRGAKLHHLEEYVEGLHPRLLPLLTLQRFYLDIEQAAQDLGYDPDQPPGLKKVTETV